MREVIESRRRRVGIHAHREYSASSTHECKQNRPARIDTIVQYLAAENPRFVISRAGKQWIK